MMNSMQRRILMVAYAALAAALVLLGVPLAWLTREVIYDREIQSLQLQASAIAIMVGSDYETDPPELPVLSGRTVGVYDLAGNLAVGHGPGHGGAAVDRAIDGRLAATVTDSRVTVGIPLSSTEHVRGAVRLSEPDGAVTDDVLLAWLAETAALVLAATAAVLLAVRQARGLATPVAALAAAARDVAAGDLSVRVEASPISELDDLATSQNAMVERLGELITREHNLGVDLSHQLRTPVTALRLTLETHADEPWVAEALAETARLEQTIDDVLALARTPVEAARELSGLRPLIAGLERTWQPRAAALGRRLVTELPRELADQDVPRRLIEQVTAVLLDNALRYGAGTISVVVAELGDVLVVSVADEGSIPDGGDPFVRGHSTSGSSGLGLALAASFATAQGTVWS